MAEGPVKYYSTNLKSDPVTFSEALLKGLAPDGGLYMPSSIPSLDINELESISGMSYAGIAFTILKKLIGKEIEQDDLRKICDDAYDFNVPLEKAGDRKFILRLDSGPTASFKDFAARMMSRLMQYYISKNNRHLTILTATSGDTGSAVASAFHGLTNINVIILFPYDEVSLMQRKQMTTLGGNIKVLAVNGKFDDCQNIVKKAFTDQNLDHLPLSSANSINTGRLLPQSVYYFYAWSRLRKSVDEDIIFSVPSGNFGNLMGGLIAQRMGLPVSRFVIATNANKEVPEFLRTGIYSPITPSLNCISSAMNVGHPSNLARIVALYGGIMNEKGEIIREPDLKTMRKHLSGISVTDDDTRKTISNVFRQAGIILEPHGAVAWKGLDEYLSEHNEEGEKLSVILETAHPAKFPEDISDITGVIPVMPVSLSGLSEKEENFQMVDNDYSKIKEILIRNN